MKKILYLHGFASSGASGTVDLLRREFWERAAEDKRATIVAPDIPLDPLVALPMLKELAAREAPDLIVGTSMGGFYAQQLHGFVRICVNPSFWLSKKYDVLYVGKHKWLNRRRGKRCSQSSRSSWSIGGRGGAREAPECRIVIQSNYFS